MNISLASILIFGVVTYFCASFLAVWDGPFVMYGRFATAIAFMGAFFLCLMEKRFAPEHRKYAIAFIVVAIYAAILSVPNLIRIHGVPGWRTSAAQEFVMYGFFAFGLSLLCLSYRDLVKVFKVILVCAITLFLLMIPKMDASFVGMAGTRAQAMMDLQEDRSVYNVQMSLAVLYVCLFLAAFSLRLEKVWRLLAVASLALTLIVSFYYSKRSTFLDLSVAVALFVLIQAFISKQKSGKRAVRIAVVVAGVAAVFAVGAFFFRGDVDVVTSRLFTRFDEILDPDRGGILGFSRILEARFLWAESPWHHRLFGAGSMFYFPSAVTGNMQHTLHIGWATVFLKGGVPLLLFFIWILFGNVRQALRCRHLPSSFAGIALAAFIAVTMSHSTIIGAHSAGFGIAMALFLYPAIHRHERRVRPGALHARAADAHFDAPSRVPRTRSQPMPMPVFRRVFPPQA